MKIMTIIDINEKYFVEADKDNYVLYEKGINKKTGKERHILIGYYTSLESALKRTIQLMIIDNNNHYTIEEYIKEYRNITESILSLFNINLDHENSIHRNRPR